MSDIAPFATLEKGESELSKKDIAAFLDTYFNFLIEMFNNEEKTFMDNFINSKNRREKDISVFSQKIRSCSFYAEYDYMLQIAELFTIIKVFSYYIDSNCKDKNGPTDIIPYLRIFFALKDHFL